jgi:hypothetical protein
VFGLKKVFAMLMTVSLCCMLIAPISTFADGGSNCVHLYSKPNFKGTHKRVCGDRKDLKQIAFDNKTRSLKTEDISVYFYFNKNYKKFYFQADPHFAYSNVDTGISSLRFNTIQA